MSNISKDTTKNNSSLTLKDIDFDIGERNKCTVSCSDTNDASIPLLPYNFPIKKTGLNHLGNTYYLNSVLQALFMTKSSRNGVISCNKDFPELFLKIQELFVLLQFSKKVSLSPLEISELSRAPGVLVGHQHDSSEFLGFLFNKLQDQENTFNFSCNFSEESGEAFTTLVQTFFSSKMLTVSRCLICGTESDRVDLFRELQLSFPNTNYCQNQTVQSLLEPVIHCY
ncbi:unnamed protein product [Phaedon cochleariae]|uniref:USP domain-containing protein n=1 Tax=Phaedon cochleariae TaxID=80249 RepID=A0A9N9SFT0_PHACE|nr:unnamed protein product [Phaedon cochleariae]